MKIILSEEQFRRIILNEQEDTTISDEFLIKWLEKQSDEKLESTFGGSSVLELPSENGDSPTYLSLNKGKDIRKYLLDNLKNIEKNIEIVDDEEYNKQFLNPRSAPLADYDTYTKKIQIKKSTWNKFNRENILGHEMTHAAHDEMYVMNSAIRNKIQQGCKGYYSKPEELWAALMSLRRKLKMQPGDTIISIKKEVNPESQKKQIEWLYNLSLEEQLIFAKTRKTSKGNTIPPLTYSKNHEVTAQCTRYSKSCGKKWKTIITGKDCLDCLSILNNCNYNVLIELNDEMAAMNIGDDKTMVG
jgi:hypothetical protein